MKRIILIAIVLFPVAASAQKLLKPNVDKISGDTTWSTSKEKLYLHGNYLTGQGDAVLCWILKIKGIKTLVLNPQTLNKTSAFAIGENQKAYLKLIDNSTITLVSSVTDVGNSNIDVVASRVISNGSTLGFYPLSLADIEKIKASPVAFLRIETSTGNFDYDIKPKYGDLIKNELALFTN